MLYPRENRFRDVRLLDGIWEFQLDPDGVGEARDWQVSLPNPEPMAVPSSFNELIRNPDFRDYVGDMWYLRRFVVPYGWTGQRVVLRFGSVHYRATVWVNGVKLGEHEGGHLPFEIDASRVVRPGEENTVAVRVSNVLTWSSVPPGYEVRVPGSGRRALEYFFDFYNYAGIHRSVHLYTTGHTFVEDIVIRTFLEPGRAIVSFRLWTPTGGADHAPRKRVQILDMSGNLVASTETTEEDGEFSLSSYRLWSPESPYLYVLRVELLDSHGRPLDSYSEPFGIRTVAVDGDRFLLNGERTYLTGCSRHEDFHLVGRGAQLAVALKDLNLLKWLGANSFRTSHYPHSEELMYLADRMGFLVIDEAPAVGMSAWGQYPVFVPERINESTLQTHIRLIRELYWRDKNHPSVVMWSIANEPASDEEAALGYFREVAQVMRALDPTRPVTAALYTSPERDRIGALLDVISVNRYFGWYTESGWLDAVPDRLKADLEGWHARYGKPVMLTEFGADSVAGLHALPAQMFSEEFQAELLRTYGQVLDALPFVMGEHVWNLADFMTKQEVRRVVGNRKGVFTRERQPKMAAHVLRSRWQGKTRPVTG